MSNAIVSPLYVVKTHVIPVATKVVDSNARVLRFAISDQRRDRDEDVIRQRGLDKKNYRTNPLVYWAHQGDFVRSPDQLPIAKAVALDVGEVKGLPTTFADKLFVPEEVGYELSRLTYDLARLGFINCCSIGFMRRKIAPVPKEYWNAEEVKAGKSERGYLIVDSELVESSLCGIPSNVGAVAQRGLAPNPEWDVDRVREVARKHLTGAALDHFIADLTGPELLSVRSLKPEDAPEPLRDLLVKAAARFDDVDDAGYDDYAIHVGKARPAEDTKSADDEPEPAGDESTLVDPAQVMLGEIAKQMNARAALKIAAHDAALDGKALTDAEAGAMEARLGMLAGSLGALITRAESVVSIVETACARMEACCAAMTVEPVAADGMTLASFAAEVRADLKAIGARVEDSHAEFYIAHLNSKQSAPRDTRSDPAPRVEAAPPPAAVAVKHSPAIDPAAVVPQIAKALSAEVAKQVEAALYKARGGISIP